MQELGEPDEPDELPNGGILYLLRGYAGTGAVRNREARWCRVCDSINYILEEDDLREVFSLVNNYLDPKGMFIFDLNTKYKYEQMGETTIAENREEASFIWDNYYDPEEEINEYELAIFIPEGEDSDLYRKFEEVHYQRAYDLATIRRLLEEAGMEFVTAYDAFTKDAPRPESERIYVVAREKGKSEK